MDNLHQKVVALAKDAQLKATFIANFSSANSTLSATGLEQEWRNALMLINQDKIDFQNVSFNLLSYAKLARGLICASEYGLSFTPNRKELYLMASLDECGQPQFEARIGYNGMQILLMRTRHIAKMSYDVVYEGDGFAWYGMDNRPTHSRTNGSSYRDVCCGYASFELTDKSVISCFVSKEELLDAINIRARIATEATGSSDSSLAEGPYRHKILSIIIFRKAYATVKNMLELRGVTVAVEQDGLSLSTDDDFIRSLQGEMNSGASKCAS